MDSMISMLSSEYWHAGVAVIDFLAECAECCGYKKNLSNARALMNSLHLHLTFFCYLATQKLCNYKSK